MQNKVYPAHVLPDTMEAYLTSMPTGRRPIYAAALLALVAAIVALPLVHVPVSVQAPGIIRPTVEKVQVRVPVSGRVEQVLVRGNQRVDRGMPLVELGAPALEDRDGTLQFRLDQVNAYTRDLRRLTGGGASGPDALSTARYRSEWEQVQSEMDELRLREREAARTLERDAELQRHGFAPDSDVESSRDALNEARLALGVLTDRYRSRWQAELAQLELDRKTLESELAGVREQRAWHHIASPVNGTVEELSSVAVGSFLQAGDVLAVISPDSTKVAEIYVSPRDVGLLRVGMPVRLQVDAFRYTDWGFVPARVTEIADDFTLVDGVPVFRIRCALERDHLRLPNGAAGVIKKGMTLHAHFVIARRSLLSLLYEDVSDWLDPGASRDARG